MGPCAGTFRPCLCEEFSASDDAAGMQILSSNRGKIVENREKSPYFSPPKIAYILKMD